MCFSGDLEGDLAKSDPPNPLLYFSVWLSGVEESVSLVPETFSASFV